MFSRIRQLLASDYGRDYGWFVEYEGTVVGELTDPQMVEMFWYSYAATPASTAEESIFYNPKLWNACRFRYRNKVMNEYTDAFCGGPDPFIFDGRIDMRGLYLVPEGTVEEFVNRAYNIWT